MDKRRAIGQSDGWLLLEGGALSPYSEKGGVTTSFPSEFADAKCVVERSVLSSFTTCNHGPQHASG